MEFRVTVTVRRRNELPSIEEQCKQKPGDRTYMTREEQAEKHGADPADIAKVEEFAKENGLRVTNTNASQRTVTLAGTADAYGKAFGVELKMYKSGEVTYRGREGDILIPENLRGIVTSVTGLDNRPFAKPHYRILRGTARAASCRRGCPQHGRSSFGSDRIHAASAGFPLQFSEKSRRNGPNHRDPRTRRRIPSAGIDDLLPESWRCETAERHGRHLSQWRNEQSRHERARSQ